MGVFMVSTMPFNRIFCFSILLTLVSTSAFAQSVEHSHSHADHNEMASMPLPQLGPADCPGSMVWDYVMGMCMPRAVVRDADRGSMQMTMFQQNIFATQSFQEGPRGRNVFAVPNMFMLDHGATIGNRHYVNLDLMATLEKWTFPEAGYPELLQIGEHQHNGRPFIDAQHPHSSPIMGLTLSDTISIGAGRDYLKFWFAPRGQPTDGPTAFMHRPTGMANPDTPLSHHVGQDAAHITSTVFASSLRLNETLFEASTFHGAEPEPTHVDLPMATPNSYAFRLIREFSPTFSAMASAGYVKNPEAHDPSLDHIWRYSASVYNDASVGEGWRFHHAFIYGLINGYDRISSLSSYLDEVWIHRENHAFWGRVEVLQRTASQLEITSALSPNSAEWLTAVTLGYSRTLANFGNQKLNIGSSISRTFLPSPFQGAYGGDPLAARVFLQLRGMEMWMR
jgi:hypothetical protein